jgi:hypothetical protein
LRDFVVLTDLITIIAMIARLVIGQMPLALTVVATGLEIAAVIISCVYLRDMPAHQEMQKSGLLQIDARVVEDRQQEREGAQA